MPPSRFCLSRYMNRFQGMIRMVLGLNLGPQTGRSISHVPTGVVLHLQSRQSKSPTTPTLNPNHNSESGVMHCRLSAALYPDITCVITHCRDGVKNSDAIFAVINGVPPDEGFQIFCTMFLSNTDTSSRCLRGVGDRHCAGQTYLFVPR